MNDHPSAFALEAFSVGEADDAVKAHIAQCPQCAAYVQILREERSALTTHQSAADFLAKPAIAAALSTHDDKTKAPWRFWRFLVPTAVAIAALISLLPQTPETPPQGMTFPEERIRVKGRTLTLQVIRERGGAQTQHQSEVSVRTGDSLKLKIELSQPRLLSAGILGADGSWQPVMDPTRLDAGTHILPEDGHGIGAGAHGSKFVIGTPAQLELVRRGQTNHGASILDLSDETSQ